MKLKHSVKLTDLTPQAGLAMVIVGWVYRDAGQMLVVTSGDDSQHKPGSKHPSGNAFDCRTKTAGIPQSQAKVLANEIRSRLTEEFDVVLESDHIHVEYDPK